LKKPQVRLEDYASWVKAMNIPLTARRAGLLRRYLDELWEWNLKFNLVGVSSYRRVLEELLLDSLVPAPFLSPRGDILDVGSGAGFPAIPLAVCRPDLHMNLVEPSARKAAFLRHCARTLGLDTVRVQEARIEDLTPAPAHGGYHVVTARAVAPLEKIIGWCAPHLHPDGRMFCFQGDRPDRVITRSRQAMTDAGLRIRERVAYHLPGDRPLRHLLILSRVPAPPLLKQGLGDAVRP